MGWVDVLIPLTGGVLLVAAPRFIIKGNDPEVREKRARLGRIGRVLLLISVVYILVKLTASGGN